MIIVILSKVAKHLIEMSAQRMKSEIWKWSTTTHSCIIIS